MLQHWLIGRDKKTTGINIAPYGAWRSQHARFKSHRMCHFISGLNLQLQPWVVPYVLLSWEGLHYHGWGMGGGGEREITHSTNLQGEYWRQCRRSHLFLCVMSAVELNFQHLHVHGEITDEQDMALCTHANHELLSSEPESIVIGENMIFF